MNTRLIDEANMRVKPDDVCVCVGDFCVRGGQKARDWSARLNGNWVFIRGNHDKNNGVKTLCDWMFVRIGQFKVFVSHIPYFYTQEERTAKYLLPQSLIDVVESTCDFAVCGHVHEKWGVCMDGAIPTINVGVDARSYRPMSDDELLGVYAAHPRQAREIG